jgi:hypothetical protein
MSAGGVKTENGFLELRTWSEDGNESKHDEAGQPAQVIVTNGHDAAMQQARKSPARKRTTAISLWEIALFAIICIADMVSTVYWYTHGKAIEANPVLSYWLNKSVIAFCIAKMTTFVPLLVLCTILRNRYARVITPGLRIAMVAYVVIYVAAVLAQLR